MTKVDINGQTRCCQIKHILPKRRPLNLFG